MAHKHKTTTRVEEPVEEEIFDLDQEEDLFRRDNKKQKNIHLKDKAAKYVSTFFIIYFKLKYAQE